MYNSFISLFYNRKEKKRTKAAIILLADFGIVKFLLCLIEEFLYNTIVMNYIYESMIYKINFENSGRFYTPPPKKLL